MTGCAINALVNDMLGKPFGWLERGPRSWYCLGIWLELVKHARGIALEDPFLLPEDHALRQFFERFLELPTAAPIQTLDLFFWRWGPERQAHVVTVESARWSVSVDEVAGVHRIATEEARRRAEKLYRLKELVAT